MCISVERDLSTTYPQHVGSISTEGQDVAYLDPRYKLYERYRGEGVESQRAGANGRSGLYLARHSLCVHKSAHDAGSRKSIQHHNM
jgi:hypothetical protein